jgi:hypothetical protein
MHVKKNCKVVSLNYIAWFQQEQGLLSWVLASLSDSLEFDLHALCWNAFQVFRKRLDRAIPT